MLRALKYPQLSARRAIIDQLLSTPGCGLRLGKPHGFFFYLLNLGQLVGLTEQKTEPLSPTKLRCLFFKRKSCFLSFALVLRSISKTDLFPAFFSVRPFVT